MGCRYVWWSDCLTLMYRSNLSYSSLSMHA
jgi:hypothetical protein